MPLRPILFRLLLALTLVLDGIAPVAAAMPVAVDAHAAMPASHAGMAGCHEEAVVAPPSVDHANASGHDGHKGCCDSSRCHCACAATLAAMPFAIGTAMTLPLPAALPHRLSAGHRAPALAHPIRPPIG